LRSRLQRIVGEGVINPSSSAHRAPARPESISFPHYHSNIIKDRPLSYSVRAMIHMIMIFQQKTTVILLFLLSLSLLLRFYRLGSIPTGLNQDESAIGYNAYSILKTGRDEYGNRLPLYFKSFGDYKLPLYIYLTAFIIKIWGLTEFAVRFPSALLGSFSVVILYLLVNQVSKNPKIAFLSAIFLAINPWHLHFSRAAFEVNAALFFALFGTWMLTKSIDSKYKLRYLLLSSTGFCLSLYSYNVTRLLSPLLLILFILYYRDKLKKIRSIDILSVGIFTLILLSPFIISIFTPSGFASAKGALLTSADVTARNLEFRSYVLALPDVFEKLFFNRFVMLIWNYFENLTLSLSTVFFFVKGSTHGNQGIGNVGMFYLFQFPLFVAGIIYILNYRKRDFYPFFIWAIVVLIVMSLSKEVPHATRGYFLAVPIQVFSAAGLVLIIRLIDRFKGLTKTLVIFSSIALIIFNINYYFLSYYYRFPILYAKAWRYGDRDLSLYLKGIEQNYSKIIFDSKSGFRYSSLLFYLAYQPEEFQKSVKREDDAEGFSQVKSFGNFVFKDINWQEDIKENNTLIITHPDNKPPQVLANKIFYYPERPIVLSDKEQLVNYPYRETAYEVIISTPL